MRVLPRSIRRISFLLFDDDEFGAFAGPFGAAEEVVDEDISFVCLGREGNAI